MTADAATSIDPPGEAPATAAPGLAESGVRLALLVVAGLAALSYAWGIGRDPLEPYYAAAVRSMSMSWHNFFYGAFDPAGTITLDKLPGAFWVQALSVRIFGYHTWAMVLPQVLEGVAAVLFLYRAVRRLAGPVAGLLAALILAASPATVALNRGNISDSAMTLLLVLAANSVSSAVATGRYRHLLAAGVWVGLAFQTKMIEAWLVLPALGLAYLLGGPGPVRRKVVQLVAGGLVTVVLSLAWMTAVSTIPRSQRPYVDGSAHDSEYAQVFDYNGFGRFGQQTPLQLLATQGLNLGLVTSPPPAWDRLFRGDLGRDTGWLLPAGLVVGVAGLFGRRRPYYALWTGWLAILVVVFSVTSTINAYYTAALSPPVAAILGAGAAGLWARRRLLRAAPREAGLASCVVLGTVGYGAWLAASAPGGAPAWLWPVAAVVGFASVVGAGLGIGVAAVVGAAPGVGGTRAGPAGRAAATLGPVALALGVVAVLIMPAAASAQIVTEGRGAFDTPYESPALARAITQLFVTTPRLAAATIPGLRKIQLGAPYLLATQTSAVASVFISPGGAEAVPIGGFTGTSPDPTLAQIQTAVRDGLFHLVLAAPSHDPRLEWIETHCRPVGKAAGTLHSYFCRPADAR